MKPVRHAISYVIYNESRSKFIIVKRPSDDDALPDVWGLPAGHVKDNETYEEALIRSGKEKLGVELKPMRFIGRDAMERDQYILHMDEFEVKIKSGDPKVPQSVQGITQYQSWKWGEGSDLEDAASKGSLCSQIFLKYL
jgi:ADP-ribose pyrophosphatase YjhB (NUDIX family)